MRECINYRKVRKNVKSSLAAQKIFLLAEKRFHFLNFLTRPLEIKSTQMNDNKLDKFSVKS